MVQATLFGLVTTAFFASALAVQVPLSSDYQWQAEHYPALSILGDGDEWNLKQPPSLNATDHLVFETVHSLLQRWPNTRMRNGHNIVPGTIPKGTLLYHGAGRKEIPPGPDWVATDPEHSYLFCRDTLSRTSQPGCWHLTLVTTRPLKVVYFDGSSAVLLPFGSTDTQDLLAWGRLSEDTPPLPQDMQRIQDLCKWGIDFGVDGFVRMVMDFEIMLCDFTSGVRVASFTNLVNLWNILPLEMTPFTAFEVFNSGSWHDRFPGETRVQLDLAQMVSFYDTQLAPSLVPVRFGQERWDHRVGNISSEDFSTVRSRLEATLVGPVVQSSGIDWKTLFQVIVDRYAQRLEFMRHLLDSSMTTSDEIIYLTNKTQTQLRIMLTPYTLLSATPGDSSDKTDLTWAIPIYQLCATAHTHPIEPELELMTDAEKLLLQAAQGTSREICRVVTRMWAAGVYAGLDPVLNTKESLNIVELTRLRNTWTNDLDRLMEWLDWSVWVKCNPGCAPQEMCYLPTWPIRFHMNASPAGGESLFSMGHDGQDPEKQTSYELRTMVMQSLAEEMWSTTECGPDEWIRPQPKCVRRIDPYDF